MDIYDVWDLISESEDYYGFESEEFNDCNDDEPMPDPF